MYVDKRLAGVQAVQTLSRLNRAHPDKDTTYVLDFVNPPGEILEAFKPYYDTATLETTTDPNLVFDLRARLDAEGHYDDFEIERVVAVELNPHATQGDLARALEPVADRLLKRYAAALEAYRAAEARGDVGAAETASEAMDALSLFKANIAPTSGCTRSCRRSSTTGRPRSRSAPFSSAACCRYWTSAASARVSTSRSFV